MMYRNGLIHSTPDSTQNDFQEPQLARPLMKPVTACDEMKEGAAMLRPFLRSSLRLFGFVLLLLAVRPMSAGWTVHGDYRGCPGKWDLDAERNEGSFATQSECEAQLPGIKKDLHMSCAELSCRPDSAGASGSSGTSAAPGHQMDEQIGNAIAAGVTGQISGADAMALAGAGIFLNMLLGGGKSAQQRAQEQAQAQAQAQARALEQERLAKAEVQRTDKVREKLLNGMQGVENTAHLGSGQLPFITDGDSAGSLAAAPGLQPRNPSASAGAGGNSLEMAMMTDDDAFGTRKARRPDDLGVHNKGAVGSDTDANHQLNAIAHADALAGGEAPRQGFDTGAIGAGAIDKSAVKTPSGTMIHIITKAEKISSDPRMIAAADELGKLKAERDKMEAELAKLKQERDAALEKDAAATLAQIKELTEKYDQKNKENQERILAISKRTTEVEKLRVSIGVELDDEVKSNPAKAPVGGKN